jgi:iron complex transport system ATP-binding protein
MLAAHAVIDNYCQYHGRRCWLGTVRQGLCVSDPLAGFVYEVTIFLDMAHTFEVLQLLDNLDREVGRTVLVVLRDLNNDARYSHHMVVLSEGRVLTAGPPAKIVTGEVLKEVFSVEAEILPDPPRSGVCLCIS